MLLNLVNHNNLFKSIIKCSFMPDDYTFFRKYSLDMDKGKEGFIIITEAVRNHALDYVITHWNRLSRIGDKIYLSNGSLLIVETEKNMVMT